MGWKLIRTKPIRPRPNQEVDLDLKLKPEKRAAIHGTVKFPDGKPVKNAVVKLFRKGERKCDLKPVTFTFTDDCGQFLFGVKAKREYVIKAFFYRPERKGGDSGSDQHHKSYAE